MPMRKLIGSGGYSRTIGTNTHDSGTLEWVTPGQLTSAGFKDLRKVRCQPKPIYIIDDGIIVGSINPQTMSPSDKTSTPCKECVNSLNLSCADCEICCHNYHSMFKQR